MTDAAPPSWPISWVGRLHGSLVFGRRTRVLAELLAQQLPPAASVLDVGCGDGTVASLMKKLRPDISVQGIEISPRATCRIPSTAYNGKSFPFPDSSVDICMFVDVLHHTPDIAVMLREACRTCRVGVLIKDHLSESWWDNQALRVMDWVGNRPHGVAIPANYQCLAKWKDDFQSCQLATASWTAQVPLYPFPVSLVCGRHLHFVAFLRKGVATQASAVR
ncbi:MAG TPA: class I SAM-dependent methyltransferase [Candidatus Saccharimonadales bacterium]|nr:class I SAM-dependent methyltransferase [Candidatus Saccharimonadales bacterium]